MTEWIANVPLFWAKIIAVATYGGGIIWTWVRPKSFIYENAPDRKIWRDLRIWITAIMLIQIALYLYF